MNKTDLLKKVNDSASTPPQTRVDKANNVAEFPAGNTATSASRIAFLNSLCRLPNYSGMVDLVHAVVRSSLV